MSINLLQLLGKCVTVITMSFMSVFNIGNYSEINNTVNNSNISKDGTIVNTITNYKTIVEYNSKLPSNISTVKVEGSVGLSYNEENTSLKKESSGEEESKKIVVQEVKDEVIEKGTGAYGVYKGKLVGYGPDCVGCSKEGYLACKTEDGSKFSLKYDGIYYNDSKYGSVRILAAKTSEFPCGTIIKISKQDGTSFMAVVMDKIGTSSANGQVLMDLAYSTQKDKTVFAADGLLGNDMLFEVQRWGW